MLLLAGFVILVSGYLGFAARREGASLVHASLLALLSAAVLQALVAGGTVWLSGTPLTHVIEPAITAWALACAAGLLGDLAAGLYPIREPFVALARVGCGPLTSSSSSSVLLEDAIAGVFDGHCATPGGRAHPAAPVPEAPAAEGPSRAPAMTSRLLACRATSDDPHRCCYRRPRYLGEFSLSARTIAR